MTDKEKLTNYETMKHIRQVQLLLGKVQVALQRRALEHDASKLTIPELSIFTEFTPKLKNSTYGSPEYQNYLKAMGPALLHHYANNQHHPEHYPNGIDGMNLIDIIEMLCDWKAATLRHDDGDINKSIKINTNRFNIEPQLVQILKNTLPLLEQE